MGNAIPVNVRVLGFLDASKVAIGSADIRKQYCEQKLQEKSCHVCELWVLATGRQIRVLVEVMGSRSDRWILY